MQNLKQINSTTIQLNNKDSRPVRYKGYTVSEVPSTFGFIYNEDKEQYGVTQWFNLKGLTYIKE
tara:strand:- start:361 stop:552 length:192 start_codon:yes stop_codon:yes gene_type:complete